MHSFWAAPFRWATHTLRRAIICALVLLLLLIVVGQIAKARNQTANSTPAAVATATPADASPSSSLPTAPAATDPGPTGTPTATRSAADTATAFVKAWARPKLAQNVWYKGVVVYATQGYGSLLTTVEPVNVPASKVTTPARVESSDDTSAVAVVGTDAGDMRVEMTNTNGEYRVNSITPDPNES